MLAEAMTVLRLDGSAYADSLSNVALNPYTMTIHVFWRGENVPAGVRDLAARRFPEVTVQLVDTGVRGSLFEAIEAVDLSRYPGVSQLGANTAHTDFVVGTNGGEIDRAALERDLRAAELGIEVLYFDASGRQPVAPTGSDESD